MHQLARLVLFISFIIATPITLANAPPEANDQAQVDDKTQIKQAYENWVKVVESAKGNATEVAALYAPDAILLPTLSPEIKIKLSDTTSQELYDFTNRDIREYFAAFTALKNLKTQTGQLYTQLFNDVAINTGLYTFEYTDDKGNQLDVPARFTFVYEKINGKWLIINHHSSYLPDGR